MNDIVLRSRLLAMCRHHKVECDISDTNVDLMNKLKTASAWNQFVEKYDITYSPNLKAFIDIRDLAHAMLIVEELDEKISIFRRGQSTDFLVKSGPPGPPPWDGLEWYEPTQRWRNPDNWIDNPAFDNIFIDDDSNSLRNAADALMETLETEYEEDDRFTSDENSMLSSLWTNIDSLAAGDFGQASPYEILDTWHETLESFDYVNANMDVDSLIPLMHDFEDALFSTPILDYNSINIGTRQELLNSVSIAQDKASDFHRRMGYSESYINTRSLRREDYTKYRALENYTGTGYKVLNSKTRDGEKLTPEEQLNTYHIQSMMKPLGEDYIDKIYRGIRSDIFFNDDGEEAQVGDTITNKSLTSTSRIPTTASDFAGNQIFLEITPDSTTQGITLDSEEETILNMGQQYRVDEIHTDVPWLRGETLQTFARVTMLPVADSTIVNPDDYMVSVNTEEVVGAHKAFERKLYNMFASKPELTEVINSLYNISYEMRLDNDMLFPPSVQYSWDRIEQTLNEHADNPFIDNVKPMVNSFENVLRNNNLLKSMAMYKEAPGPPPWEGLVWYEPTKRWRNPDNWRENSMLSDSSINGYELSEAMKNLQLQSYQQVKNLEGGKELSNTIDELEMSAITNYANPYDVLDKWHNVLEVFDNMNNTIDMSPLLPTMKEFEDKLFSLEVEQSEQDEEDIYGDTDEYIPKSLDINNLEASYDYMSEQAEKLILDIYESEAFFDLEYDHYMEDYNEDDEESKEELKQFYDEDSDMYITPHVTLNEYVNMEYIRINKSQRGEVEMTPATQRHIENMSMNMSWIDTDIILYRGMKEPLVNDDGDEAKVGDIIDMKAFSSTSRDPKVAKGFADRTTFIEIQPMDGIMGIDLSTGEHETILDAGQKLIIDEIHNDVDWPGDFSNMRHFIKARMAPHDYEIEKSIVVEKDAPGPPPWEGLVWYEPTKRWRNPDNWHDDPKLLYRELKNPNLPEVGDKLLNTVFNATSAQEKGTPEYDSLLQMSIAAIQLSMKMKGMLYAHPILDDWHQVLDAYDNVNQTTDLDTSDILDSMKAFEGELFNSDIKRIEPDPTPKLLDFNNLLESLEDAEAYAQIFDYENEPNYIKPSEDDPIGQSIIAYQWGWAGQSSVNISGGMINRAMKGEEEMTPEIQQHIENIQSVMKPAGEERIVYRGIPEDLFDIKDDDGMSLKEGSITTLKSFTSTSRNPDLSTQFARGKVFMELVTDPNTEAITLGPDNIGQYEHETILNSGQKIQVESIRKGIDWPLMTTSLGMSNVIRARVLPNERQVEKSMDVEKEAPGPPPWEGLVWYEPTKRWRNPENWQDNPELASRKIHSEKLPILSNSINRIFSQIYGSLTGSEHSDEYKRSMYELAQNSIGLFVNTKTGENDAHTLLDKWHSVLESFDTANQDNSLDQFVPVLQAFEDELFSSPVIEHIEHTEMDIDNEHQTKRSLDFIDTKVNEFEFEKEPTYTYADENSEGLERSINVYQWSDHEENVGSGRINRSLKGEEPMTPEVQKHIENLQTLMKPIGHENYPKVYRGIPIKEFLNDEGEIAKAGDVVTNKEFMSTSRGPSTADYFAGFGGVFIELSLGSDTEAITMSDEENETLLNTGQKMRIDKIRNQVPWGAIDHLSGKSQYMGTVIKATMLPNEGRNLDVDYGQYEQAPSEVRRFRINHQSRKVSDAIEATLMLSGAVHRVSDEHLDQLEEFGKKYDEFARSIKQNYTYEGIDLLRDKWNEVTEALRWIPESIDTTRIDEALYNLDETLFGETYSNKEN